MDKVVTDYMEKLDNINEDSRFQSYMSAEEDNRKMLNTYKEKAEKAEREKNRAFEQGRIEAYREMLNNGVSIETIAKSLSITVEETRKLLS